MSLTRRVLGPVGGSLAVVGMLAAPAFACLSGDAAVASTTAPAAAFSDQLHDAPLTLAERQAKLTATLDRLAARLAADTAQWSGLAPTTVLTRAQRDAAKADLAKALWSLRALDAVPDSWTTAAQRSQISSLTTGLRRLVGDLRTLLANKPAVTAPVVSTAPVADRLEAIEARTASDTAQWAAVSSLSTRALKQAAWADLLAAKRNLWYLGTVQQTAAVDELQADVLALKARLKALLSTSFDRDGRCDRDGVGDRRTSSWGDRDGSRDGSWGDRYRR